VLAKIERVIIPSNLPYDNLYTYRGRSEGSPKRRILRRNFFRKKKEIQRKEGKEGKEGIIREYCAITEKLCKK
jgi:hypothetical protein